MNEGKIVSFGDYDQCLNIEYNLGKWESKNAGQYCVAQVELSAGVKKEFKESMLDVFPAFNYYYPRYSVCLPDSCSEEDVTKILNWSLKDAAIVVHDNQVICTKKMDAGDEKRSNSIAVTISKIFLSILTAVVIVSTYFDCYNPGLSTDVIKIFSIKESYQDLISNSDSNDRSLVLDVFKFFFITGGVIAHSLLAIDTPYGLPLYGKVKPLMSKIKTIPFQMLFNDAAIDQIFVLGYVLASKKN